MRALARLVARYTSPLRCLPVHRRQGVSCVAPFPQYAEPERGVKLVRCHTTPESAAVQRETFSSRSDALVGLAALIMCRQLFALDAGAHLLPDEPPGIGNL